MGSRSKWILNIILIKSSHFKVLYLFHHGIIKIYLKYLLKYVFEELAFYQNKYSFLANINKIKARKEYFMYKMF